MKKTLSILVLIILIAAGGYYFYQTQHKSTENTDKKAEKEVIKVGVFLPMTGELATYGEPILEGIKMAVQENDSLRYQIKYDDTKGEPKTAINIVNKFLNLDNIRYFIGDVSSPVTLSVVPIIEKNNAMLVCPGASSPKLINISKIFIRNYPSSASESKDAANFILDSLKQNKVAMIYVNNDYGIGLKEGFVKAFTKRGGKVTLLETYNFGERNFRNIISKLIDSDVNTIYLGGNPKEMGYFSKQLAETKKKYTIVSNISYLTPDCLNIAGKSAIGVIVPVAYYNPNDPNSSGVQKFSKLYQETHNGKLPSVLNAIGYDAGNLIIQGIKKEGDNPIKVAEYLRNLKNYEGALGNLSFDNGEVQIPIQFKFINQNLKPEVLTDMKKYIEEYGH